MESEVLGGGAGERERMTRERERERERMTCQPGGSQVGDRRINYAFPLRWCQYLRLEKGRASI